MMDEIDRKILSSTSSLLTGLVQSGVLEGHKAVEAKLAVGALNFALARDDYEPARIERLRLHEDRLSAEFALLFGEHTQSEREHPQLSRWGDQAGEELASVVARLSGGALSRQDDENLVARRLHEFLISLYEPVIPDVAAGSRAVYGRVEVAARPEPTSTFITGEGLQRYMRARFPDAQELQVTKLEIVQGGYSKATYIADLKTRSREHKLVIRQDRPGLPTGSSVVQEFAVLREIYSADVPVPKPLWVEEDMTHFGAAVMAVEFCPGVPGRELPVDPKRQMSWTLSFAEVLAKLHVIPGIPALDVRDVVRFEIETMSKRFAAMKRLPYPGVEFGIAWLLNHIEDLAGRPVCRTHGDLAFHNVLINEDKIRAALDWEFTHFCDPAEDLAYIKKFIDEFGLWNEFVRHYKQHGGFDMDEKSCRYFAVFNNVKISVGIAGLLNAGLLPDMEDIKLINTGVTNLPRFEIDVINSIIHGS